MTTTVKRYNQSVAAAVMTPSDVASVKAVTIDSPTSSEDRSIFYTDVDLVLSKLVAIVVGSSPSVTWTIRYGTDRSAAGTEVVTGGTTTTSQTSGSVITSFANATIPASNFVWLETTAKSGTVASLGVALKFGVSASSGGGGSPPTGDTPTWTTFVQDGTDRIIYVSATGNDSNNGLTSGTPKLTIAAGKALLRNGHADWLLLKCGDTWTNQNFGDFNGISGRSSDQYMLVGSYGTGARPIVNTGVSNGIQLSNNADLPANYVAIVGIEMFAHTYTGTNGSPAGVYWLSHSTGLLIEDCYIHGYATNVLVQGYYNSVGDRRHTNVTIRAGSIADSYHWDGSQSFSTGLYMSGVDGILVEYALLDRNGWNDDFAGSEFCHNGYIQNGNTGAVFRKNIVAGTDGIEFRCGGTFDDNLLLRNAVAINFGLGTTPEDDGVFGTVRNNVVLDGGNIVDGDINLIRGWPLRMANVAACTVSGNIFANNVHGSYPRAMSIETDAHTGRGVENVIFQSNIVSNWTGGYIYFFTPTVDVVNCQFINNDVYDTGAAPTNRLVYMATNGNYTGLTSSGNRFYSQNLNAATNYMSMAGSSVSLATWKSHVSDTTSTGTSFLYVDSTRDIGTYSTSIGGDGTYDDFLAEARLQSRQNWRVEYSALAVNTYIRAGFGL